MTNKEFYLRAMLAMAANPKYVEMKKQEDEPGVEFPELQVDIIEMDAQELMKTAENNWPDAFCEDGISEVVDQLNDISNALNGNLSVIVEEA